MCECIDTFRERDIDRRSQRIESRGGSILQSSFKEINNVRECRSMDMNECQWFFSDTVCLRGSDDLSCLEERDDRSIAISKCFWMEGGIIGIWIFRDDEKCDLFSGSEVSRFLRKIIQ